MPGEQPGVDIKEVITLNKIEGDIVGDPDNAVVVETVKVEDGTIVEQTVHTPPIPYLSL